MGLTLVNPLALFGLMLLAVPVAIHLLSRGEPKLVEVGSLRWLAPASMRRVARLQWRDPWRLALRCALLSLLVLALSAPQWRWPGARVTEWVLVDPALARSPSLAPAVTEREARAREQGRAMRALWLTSSLREFPKPVEEHDAAPLYPQLRHADERLGPGPFLVLARPVVDRLGWQRPTLSRAVEWRVLEDVPDARDLSSIGEPRQVSIVHDGRAVHADRVEDAVAAWSASPSGPYEGRVVRLDQLSQAPSTPWVVWLAARPGEALPEEVAARLRAGGIVLSDGAAPFSDLPRALAGAPLVRHGSGEVWVSQRAEGQGQHLRVHEVIDEGLLAQPTFAQWLLELFSVPWQSPLPAGLRVPVAQATPKTLPQSVAAPPVELAPWLFALAGGLWLADRLWSVGGKRDGTRERD